MTWSMNCCHIDGLDDTPNGRHLYRCNPLCVFIVTSFCDASSSSCCWYVLFGLTFVKHSSCQDYRHDTQHQDWVLISVDRLVDCHTVIAAHTYTTICFGYAHQWWGPFGEAQRLDDVFILHSLEFLLDRFTESEGYWPTEADETLEWRLA